jgi:hypothetical protein
VTPDERSSQSQLRPFLVLCGLRLRLRRPPCSQLPLDVPHPSVVVAGPQPGRDFGITLRRTTEVAEGTEGCVRSWVVRVAPGSAHSQFELTAPSASSSYVDSDQQS